MAIKLRVMHELAVFQAHQAFGCSQPKSAVPGGDQATYIVAGETLTRRRHPGNGPNAIETQQPGFGCKPKVPVRCLSNLMNNTRSKALADFPHGVGVLTYVERGI